LADGKESVGLEAADVGVVGASLFDSVREGVVLVVIDGFVTVEEGVDEEAEDERAEEVEEV